MHNTGFYEAGSNVIRPTNPCDLCVGVFHWAPTYLLLTYLLIYYLYIIYILYLVTTYNVLYTDERDRTQGRVNLLSIKMMLTEKLALGACRTCDPPSPASTLKT